MNGIKYIREKSNITQYWLAERIGVTRQTVTQWEKGVRKPNKEHLKWLCEFYGIEEKWFGKLSGAELDILNEMYKLDSLNDGFRQSEKDGWLFDPEYMNELVELMTKHWKKKKKTEMEACENFLRGLREAKKQTDSDTESEGRKKQ